MTSSNKRSKEKQPRLWAVVEPSRQRCEDDDPVCFVGVIVAHSVPVAQLSAIVQQARKKIATDSPSSRTPSHLKLVDVCGDVGSVLLGLADSSAELSAWPLLQTLALKRMKAPAEPPLSRKQAERWAELEDLWPTVYRPLAADEVPPAPFSDAEIGVVEGFMRVALEEAHKAAARGDVC